MCVLRSGVCTVNNLEQVHVVTIPLEAAITSSYGDETRALLEPLKQQVAKELD
jgi:hypothetical protein